MTHLDAPAVVDEGLVRRLRTLVAGELSRQVGEALRSTGRRLDQDDQGALARKLIDDQLEQLSRDNAASGRAALSETQEEAVAQSVFDRIFQLGRLQPLIEDERIMNISANGCDQVFIELADGTKVETEPIAASDAEMIDLLREIGRRYGLSEREFNPARPQLNLQLPDGSRLFAVAWVCDRPALSIRRHRFMKVTLDDLVGLGAIDRGLHGFLAAAVRARKQLMIAGATGAGKTTLLRALASEIPPNERIVTIETELELGLNRYPDLHPDCVALEAREANVEGVGEITAAELVRASLRMNPDRVIVGEVRGSEVIPMLNAMSQGNEGSMCTIHADGSGTVFNKLALYAMQSPERLPMEATNLLAASALDLLVYIAKTRDGRFVASVRQVIAADGRQVVTNELYRPGHDGRAVPGMPIPRDLLDELCEEGYDPALHENAAGWWT
jgi:Flp pilus assembly CpaF family ATPase